MKQALWAVPYMAISSESLLSAVIGMEGTQKCPWHRCFIKNVIVIVMVIVKISVSFVYFVGEKILVPHSWTFVDRIKQSHSDA